jgi:3-oxoacyl-[acyl-carrier protein] reductase
MDLGLSNLAFIVTGGSAGLGLASASALVAEGASVVISSRGKAELDAAVRQLGSRARGVVADNADPATSISLGTAALEHFGRLDGVLVSVGGPPPSTVMETTDECWRAAMESVFLGAVRIARESVTRMSSGGAVGFVLSSSVRSPIPELALSNALRPALAMTAKALADEVGPDGIRVFGLMPGRIATRRTEELDHSRPGSREASEASIPLRRLGRPEEFGRVAAFLLSPAASYMTGCMLPVDGGLMRTP